MQYIAYKITFLVLKQPVECKQIMKHFTAFIFDRFYINLISKKHTILCEEIKVECYEKDKGEGLLQKYKKKV